MISALVKKDNLDSIFIYKLLFEEYNNCKKSLNPEINIFSLFFHQFMKILSGYALKKNEIESIYKPDKNIFDLPINTFPYIDYKDVYKSVDFSKKILNFDKYIETKNNSLFKKNFISFLSSNYNYKGKRLGIIPGSIFNKKLLLKLALNFKISFLDNVKVEIDQLDAQLKLLNQCLEKIFGKVFYGENHNKMYFLLKKHIINESNTGTDYNNQIDILIAGPMGKSISSKYSHLVKNQGKKVISIMHGEGDQLMFDEPVFGYSDRSLCTHLFGYGDNLVKTNDSNFLKSLEADPTYIPSNSNLIKKLYKKEKQLQNIKDYDALCWLYAPDSILYHRRYGPFSGSIPPKLYIIWQKKLMNSFKNIFFKKHPKGHSLSKNISKSNLSQLLNTSKKNIIEDHFLKVFHSFDGFVFDHISTAFMIAASTEKPIIYFNIGKRNLTVDGDRKIKERCTWIDIDLENINIREGLKFADKKDKINNLTDKFSLTHETSLREESFMTFIKTL